MPRVTIIIATYNWSNVLPYSIGSVLRQSFADFELLVIGDGCTDDSGPIVEAIGDPRVQWINLPRNTRHQSGPNNEGLARARGAYIAYLGHDDLWLPHHLEVMVEALDRTRADLAYSLAAIVAADGNYVFPTVPNPSAGMFGSPLSIVHRKSMTDRIGGWLHYRAVKTTPDVELWQRAYAAGLEFTFVPRLTGVKFPAGQRRNVYVAQPCHEQAAWSARIEAEPDFEFRQMADFVVGPAVPGGVPYRTLLANLFRQTAARLNIRRAGAARLPGLKPRSIDVVRRFKGL